MIVAALVQKEIAAWLRRPGVYAFVALFFALGVLTMGSIAGSIEFIRVGGFGGQLKADSPYVFVNLGLVWALFATMNLASASAGAATRDVTDGMHALVYATPASRWALLVPRYLGALFVGALLVAAAPLGMLAGTALPWLEAERVGARDLGATLLLLLVWLGPNTLFTTALFFAIGSFTRRMFPAYIGGVLLFVGYLGASAFGDLDERWIAALIDPFGSAAIDEVTRYWTPAEQNALAPWPSGFALANRLLWTGVGIGLLAVAFVAAPLDEHGWQPLARFQRPERADPDPDPGAAHRPVPSVTRRFDAAARALQGLVMTRRAIADVLGHRYFWAFVGAAVLFQLLNANNIGRWYGTETWPVTYQVIGTLEGTLGLFLLVITTFYAGDLVWQDRDRGSDALIDATPTPDVLPLIARVAALLAIVVGLHATVLVVGPLVQLSRGYTHFEWGQYLTSLFGLSLLEWFPLVVLALVVHVVVNHKVVGHALVIGLYVGMSFRTGYGFELNIPWFGSDPGRVYSDMNGWGFSLAPFLLYRLTWVAAAGVLLAVARLLWVRGSALPLRGRLAEARRRADLGTVAFAGGSALTFVSVAGWITWQTVVAGDYENSLDAQRDLADYERRFAPTWKDAPHPVVTDVDATVDLFPSRGTADVRATLTLTNPHPTPIATMLVNFGERDDPTDIITLDAPYTEVWDERLDVRIWTLDPPLAPGATATLTFATAYGQRGMANDGFETAVVPNGTFLFSGDVFPSFGYLAEAELADPADRRKQGLPPRPRMRDLDDPKARDAHYLTDDAHRAPFQVRLSTEAGQTPLAPGDVVQQGVDVGGRPWRLYRADRPIFLFYAFLSGTWEVARRDDGPVPVEVWYDPAHAYNVDRMLDGMVDALTVFERDFSPFQHPILRIVEFPRYQSFAQSYPTLVPFSEAIGFIARVADPDEDIDYVYYVTAHEVAHQWWAHQVIAGDGQGATLLSESMSQYAALKVMEQEYGTDQINRFLTYEADNYFSSRSGERDAEQPLMRVNADQSYIHYQKGGVILYALSERIGRERFDASLADFLRRWAFQGPPYPTARDLVDHLLAAFPEHEPAIRDGLASIVVYDLRVGDPTAAPTPGGFTLRLDPTVQRYRVAGDGAELAEPFLDDVELRVTLDGGGEHRAKVRLGDGPVDVALDRRPTAVELDPRGLFLDRDRDDNTAPVPAP